MAEIPIQKKEGHSLWWLWANHGTTTTAPVDSTAVTAPAAAPPVTDSATVPRTDTTAPR